MYLVVITDEHLKSHNAVTFDNISGVRVALYTFNPSHGFSTMVFKLNSESGVYEEIFPEVTEYGATTYDDYIEHDVIALDDFTEHFIGDTK